METTIKKLILPPLYRSKIGLTHIGRLFCSVEMSENGFLWCRATRTPKGCIGSEGVYECPLRTTSRRVAIVHKNRLPNNSILEDI